jgi:hypothetical protein
MSPNVNKVNNCRTVTYLGESRILYVNKSRVSRMLVTDVKYNFLVTPTTLLKFLL